MPLDLLSLLLDPSSLSRADAETFPGTTVSQMPSIIHDIFLPCWAEKCRWWWSHFAITHTFCLSPFEKCLWVFLPTPSLCWGDFEFVVLSKCLDSGAWDYPWTVWLTTLNMANSYLSHLCLWSLPASPRSGWYKCTLTLCVYVCVVYWIEKL